MMLIDSVRATWTRKGITPGTTSTGSGICFIAMRLNFVLNADRHPMGVILDISQGRQSSAS